ncbi:Tryptophan--tRNA ligase, partial [Trypanosoma cruzi]
KRPLHLLNNPRSKCRTHQRFRRVVSHPFSLGKSRGPPSRGACHRGAAPAPLQPNSPLSTVGLKYLLYNCKGNTRRSRAVQQKPQQTNTRGGHHNNEHAPTHMHHLHGHHSQPHHSRCMCALSPPSSLPPSCRHSLKNAADAGEMFHVGICDASPPRPPPRQDVPHNDIRGEVLYLGAVHLTPAVLRRHLREEIVVGAEEPSELV